MENSTFASQIAWEIGHSIAHHLANLFELRFCWLNVSKNFAQQHHVLSCFGPLMFHVICGPTPAELLVAESFLFW